MNSSNWSRIFFGSDFCVVEQSKAKRESWTLHSPHSFSLRSVLDTPLLIAFISFGWGISGAFKELTDFMSECDRRYQSSGPPRAKNREWHEARIKLVYISSIFVTFYSSSNYRVWLMPSSESVHNSQCERRENDPVGQDVARVWCRQGGRTNM